MLKKIITAIFVSVFVYALVACKDNTDTYLSDDIFAMDTFINVVYTDCAGVDVKEICENELDRIENIFSRTKANSEIYAINNSLSTTVSDECTDVILQSLNISDKTSGAFNPAIGQITTLWDITGKKYVPHDSEIDAVLPFCDYNCVKVNGTNITKEYPDTMLDLGACVKGYAAEKIIGLLKYKGVENAMISIGGNIAVTGSASGRNGTWRIGIRSPYNTDEIAGYIDCTDKVISVSGDYERYFERDGIIYHHIFDSFTGKPARTDIKSVAVIAQDGLLSDALSTALFCMGSEEALLFYKKGVYDFEAVIFKHNGNIICTDGIKDDFVYSR